MYLSRGMDEAGLREYFTIGSQQKRITPVSPRFRRTRIGQFGIGITCALEHCGREQPAAFTEGGIVCINADHPLYRKQQEKGQDMLGFFLTYLLSQQVALMLAEGDTRRAFDLQNRLLTDSW